MPDINLKTPLKQLGITYKMNAGKLEKLGIESVEDLLMHIPSRYEDLTLISEISLIQPGETVTIKGYVTDTNFAITKNRKRIQEVTIEDKTGKNVCCIWFNQTFILKLIKPGNFASISGKVILFQKKPAIIVNEYEILKEENDETVHTGRLVPIYPETRGLSSKWIRNRIKEIINRFDTQIEDYMPDKIIDKYNLLSFPTALRQVHFPNDMDIVSKARYRLAFDELFLAQLSSAFRRKEWKERTTAHVLKTSIYKVKIDEFIGNLPFRLTGAQKKSVQDIFADVSSTRPMNRLLEGDVGSGKTVVAVIAIFLAYLNGYRSIFMAPTEILANQHFETISRFLSPFGVNVGLVTGSNKTGIMKIGIKNNESLLRQGSEGRTRIMEKNNNHNSKFIIPDSKPNFDILVGTHALLYDKKLKLDKLGLVIVDEQQRFGVEQRTTLRDKGTNPHFLTMTATPIPRTIFLTIYGDLDLSYLNEMPKGRKRIKTWLVPKIKREAAYEWIKKKINEKDSSGVGNQVFIICPFIEESESMNTVKAAVIEFEKLKNEIFKNYSVGLLHGKLKSKEKQEVLEDFRSGKHDILVATPVVEVGIDIKNATIMMIEASERFGLAQLHQLRGRVGRGDKESYCLLFTGSGSPETIQRLKSLETTHLGAELAEIDLKLRGPGKIFGTMQHGKAELKIASFSDLDLIGLTKYESEFFLEEINKYPKLLEKVKLNRVENISPD